MTHFEFVAAESYVSRSDRAFEAYVAKVERISGQTTDQNGISLLMSDDVLIAFQEATPAADFAASLCRSARAK